MSIEKVQCLKLHLNHDFLNTLMKYISYTPNMRPTKAYDNTVYVCNEFVVFCLKLNLIKSKVEFIGDSDLHIKGILFSFFSGLSGNLHKQGQKKIYISPGVSNG